ncbi:hypothetical protein Tco_0523206 [Tanacetum coccineum]
MVECLMDDVKHSHLSVSRSADGAQISYYPYELDSYNDTQEGFSVKCLVACDVMADESANTMLQFYFFDSLLTSLSPRTDIPPEVPFRVSRHPAGRILDIALIQYKAFLRRMVGFLELVLLNDLWSYGNHVFCVLNEWHIVNYPMFFCGVFSSLQLRSVEDYTILLVTERRDLTISVVTHVTNKRIEKASWNNILSLGATGSKLSHYLSLFVLRNEAFEETFQQRHSCRCGASMRLQCFEQNENRSLEVESVIRQPQQEYDSVLSTNVIPISGGSWT